MYCIELDSKFEKSQSFLKNWYIGNLKQQTHTPRNYGISLTLSLTHPLGIYQRSIHSQVSTIVLQS